MKFEGNIIVQGEGPQKGIAAQPSADDFKGVVIKDCLIHNTPRGPKEGPYAITGIQVRDDQSN